MIRRNVLDEIDESDRRFLLASDYDFYLRVLNKYPLVIIDRPLVHWRYHSSSASGPDTVKSLNWDRDTVQVWRKHLHSASADTRRHLRDQIKATLAAASREAYYYGQKSNPAWARRYLFKLWQQNPSAILPLCHIVGLALSPEMASLATVALKRFRKVVF